MKKLTLVIAVFLITISSAFAYVCLEAIPSDTSLWPGIGNAFQLNGNPVFFDFDGDTLPEWACCGVGENETPIGGDRKPFPNACTDDYYSICSEDSEQYTAKKTYDIRSTTNRFCVNPDNTSWRWETHTGGMPSYIQNTTEICSGGFYSIDNDCNLASLNLFAKNRNGGLNYEVHIFNNQQYLVHQDPDAFDPACRSDLDGYVADQFNDPISSARIQMILVGPRSERLYLETFTNASGYYQFTNVPSSIFKILYSKESFNPHLQIENFTYQSVNQINVTLDQGLCLQDCTTSSRPGICSSACDGFNGCAFYNTTVASFLNGRVANYDYQITLPEGNYLVSACEGIPQPYFDDLSRQNDNFACPSGSTLVIIERVALQDGEPVKVIIPVCRR
jgi:hypothetical protein